MYSRICLVGRLSNRKILPKHGLTGQFFLRVNWSFIFKIVLLDRLEIELQMTIIKKSFDSNLFQYTIENVTKTRLVVADKRIHILGSFQNIQVARRAICALILGSPPAKVYGNMRNAAARTGERF